jgi:hypothetical protein
MTSAPVAALCADAAALRSSLDALRNVTVQRGAEAEIRADLEAVKNNLSAVVKDLSGRWRAETDALRTAVTKLETAVGTLVASPGSQSVSGVQTAWNDVEVAARNLLSVVAPDCPAASGSPSPSR